MIAHVECEKISVCGKKKITVKSGSKYPITVKGFTISGDSNGKRLDGSGIFDLIDCAFVTFACAENTTVFYQIE